MPLHLLRLVSPSLPVGAFSYSRGLEAAVHAGWVINEASARDWILGTLGATVAPFDAALFWRMSLALEAGDRAAFHEHDAWLSAGRESAEMQREDRALGGSLLQLLRSLDVPLARETGDGISFAAAFAIAAHHWRIPPAQGLEGLLWVFVEGQVAAAIRLVPLGQTAGQRILVAAASAIPEAARHARSIADDDVGNLAPALAMASAWHETQYSRLFQS